MIWRIRGDPARHARTALVVGSGFIGCEAAVSLALRGLDVLVDEVCVYQPTPIDVEHLAAVIDALA
mgnify:CR=1 FL=1